MKQILFIFSIIIGISATAQPSDIFNLARTGNVTEAEKLIKESPELVNSENPQGYTPLILACYYNQTEFVAMLIKNKVKLTDKQGSSTALQAASYKGFVEPVRLLLEYGANPNIADANGATALIYATQFNHVEIVRLLIQYEVDTKYKDPNGQAALDYAKQLGLKEISKLLSATE